MASTPMASKTTTLIDRSPTRNQNQGLLSSRGGARFSNSMKNLVHEFCRAIVGDVSNHGSVNQWWDAVGCNQPGKVVLDWLRELQARFPQSVFSKMDRGQVEPTDHTELLNWLRAQVARQDTDIFGDNPLLPVGSHELFGAGADRDFLIDYKDIPVELHPQIPPPKSDTFYYEPFSRIVDEEMGFDFLICEKQRVDEFRFAMNAMHFMKTDRPGAFNKLQYNKELRVSVFRVARSCFPGSELIAGEGHNPDIDEPTDPHLL